MLRQNPQSGKIIRVTKSLSSLLADYTMRCVLAGFLVCILACRVSAGDCYTSSYISYPSYSSCVSYPVCSSSIYDGFYHYHHAGWYEGRYFSAGLYAWNNNCWNLQGSGPCYGAAYAPGYHHVDDTVFFRFAAVLPLVDLPTYSAQYQTPVTAQAVTGGQTGGLYQQQTQTQVQQTQQTQQVQTAAVQTQTVTQDKRVDELLTLVRGVAKGQQHAQVSHQILAVRMDKLERRMTALEGSGSPVSVEPTPEPDPLPETPSRPLPAPANRLSYSPADLSVAQAKCVACHGQSVDRPKGAPVLLDTAGNPLALSQEGKESVAHQLDNKLMPPQKSGVVLSAAEEASVRRVFTLKEAVGTQMVPAN